MSSAVVKRKRNLEEMDLIDANKTFSSSDSVSLYSYSKILKESNIPALVGNLIKEMNWDKFNDDKLSNSNSDNEDSVTNEMIESEINRSNDPYGPFLIKERVDLIVQRWGPLIAISPDKFLLRILDSRGYCTDMISSMESQYRRKPTLKEMEDYDNDILTAIRLSDLNKLKLMKEDGRTLTACNRYGESIVHMACRRSDFNIVEYVLDNIEEQCLIDDYGRTPLHDACWRSEPRFDIVTLLLDKNINLLRFQDVRGSNPLNYVREEHWLQWCAYFFHQKEKYWKI